MSETNKLRVKIALLGLCLSLVTFFMGGMINRDGVIYLETAKVFEESGFIASFRQFKWPFYSIVISTINSITSLTLENSAYFLNAIIMLILLDSFVRLYWELNSKIRYLWMPAVILLAFIGLNDYRQLIVRDWGYWAFLFLALLYFIKAYKKESISSYLLWQVFIILAFLFRIEAAAYLLLLPLLLLIKKRSIVSFISSISLVLASVGLLIFYNANWYEGGRVPELLAYIDVISYVNRFVEYSYIVASHALRHHAESNAVLFTLSGLLGVVIVKTVAKLGMVYIAIIVLGKLWNKALKNFEYLFVNILIAVSFGIVFIFFCNSKIIAGRYIVSVTLFILLYVTYYAEVIYDKIKSNNNYWMIGLFASILLLNLIAGIKHSDTKKKYIKEMGVWVQNNISNTATVTFNDSRLYYYSDGIYRKNMTRNLDLRNNQYALLRIKKNDIEYNELIQQGKLVKVHAMTAESGDSAVLFKIINL